MLGVLADNVGAVLPVLTLLVSLLAVWTATRALAGNVRPQVECYMRVRPGSHVFYLALSNFGRGSAKNVAIELVGVDEQDFAEHGVIPKWRKKGTFVLLEPQGTVSTMFGFAPRLVGKDAAPLKPFAAVVKYEWKPFWTWRKRAEQETFDMDVRAFEGLVLEHSEDEVAKVLKKELPKLTAVVDELPSRIMHTGIIETTRVGDSLVSRGLTGRKWETVLSYCESKKIGKIKVYAVQLEDNVWSARAEAVGCDGQWTTGFGGGEEGAIENAVIALEELAGGKNGH